MRIKFTTIILIVIALCFITSCTKRQDKMEVYSFSGENENITISNGLIIVTDGSEKFIGGDLSFKVEEPSDVKSYFKKFFFYKDGVEITILNGSTTTEGATKGLHISSDLGSISSKDLFYDNDLELIKGSLNFSISGNLMNGEDFEYNLVLVVKKVY
ncbi:hypothetical protein RBU61_08910 [Tissierella sp. MB52-C2]|uniref:hypothetical protein n=1 Tax=Tissierella sp. MB52-C2 TaxID=3070999 RepID=UPI00280B3583|nr:hypothetical protein [Tissierella sp. MB52-C2]WMM26785.1 hypothetical protein RBU61_08910 [Tissierella sp. MB52-C2]